MFGNLHFLYKLNILRFLLAYWFLNNWILDFYNWNWNLFLDLNLNLNTFNMNLCNLFLFDLTGWLLDLYFGDLFCLNFSDLFYLNFLDFRSNFLMLNFRYGVCLLMGFLLRNVLFNKLFFMSLYWLNNL